MNPTHYKSKQALRTPVGRESQHPEVAYFPNGMVAAPPFLIVNPVSHSEGSFPGNGTPNDLIGPPDARWITVRDSDEQGKGVPAFKRWPRQFHSETYDYSSMAVMPLPDQVAAIPSGPGESLYVNDYGQRPEVAGWSAPYYGEQYEQPIAAQGLGTGVANLRDPRTIAYAIGWGAI